MTPVLAGARLRSTACGLLMAAAAGIDGTGTALAVAATSALAVLVGFGFRAGSLVAVVLAAAAVADSTPLVAGLTGLAATCYLVLRYHPAPTGRAFAATMSGALGFTAVGVAAAAFPWELPWLPLLAAPAVLASYVLATKPFITASDDEGRRQTIGETTAR